VPPRRLTRSKASPPPRPPRQFVDRSREGTDLPGVADEPFDVALIVSWAGRSATARSTTSVMIILRPSTISDEDAASPKRSLLEIPRYLSMTIKRRCGQNPRACLFAASRVGALATL